MHMCDCSFCDSCGEEVGDTLVHVRVPIKRHKKERAVIEAAKALQRTWDGQRIGLTEAITAVAVAVEALECAEEEQ
jgi:hypothetical protein